MCHESSGVALTETIGIGKGTVTLDDVHAAELIIVVGQNPGTNHPRMLTALEQAKRNGAAIVADQPAARGRSASRFRNPQRLRGLARPGHGAGRPLPAGRGRRRPRAVPAGSTARLLDATTPSIDEFVDAPLRRVRRAWPPTSRALDADALLAATGLDAGRGEAFGRPLAAATHDRRAGRWG